MAFEPAGEVIQVPGLLPVHRPYHRTVEILTGHILANPRDHRHYIERLWDHYTEIHFLEVLLMYTQAMNEHHEYFQTDGDFWANTARRLHLSFAFDPEKRMLGVDMVILEDAPHLLAGVWFDFPDVRVF